jgi:CRP/FNR family transcriptional regulator, nitrogen oxide reductase regulator
MSSAVECLHDYIRNVDIFSGLREPDLDRVLRCAYEQSYKADKYLFYQDDPASTFYLLLSGHIKLSQLTPEGNQVVLHFLNPGDAFGIVAVLRGINFPVTAKVVEDCRVLAWDQETMKRMMVCYPQISLNAIQILSTYILGFQNRIRELTTERVERRIVRALLRVAQQAGRKVDKGVVIDLALTRQDLAEMAGTTIYTISRTLTKLEAENLIEWKSDGILVKAPHKLVEIAEDRSPTGPGV